MRRISRLRILWRMCGLQRLPRRRNWWCRRAGNSTSTLSDLRDSLMSLMRYRLSNSSRRVHELAARRGFRRPVDLLRQQRQRSDEMTSRLAMGLRARLEQSRKRFNVTHLRIVSFDFHKQIVRLRNRTNDFAARIELALRGRVAQARRRYDADHLRLVSFDFRRKVAAFRLSAGATSDRIG